MAIYFSILGASLALAAVRADGEARLISILTNSSVLFFGSLSTLATFFVLLTGYAPLVAFLSSGELLKVLGKAAATAPFPIPIDLAAVLGKFVGASDERIVPRTASTQADDAELNFLTYLSRSQEAARTAQRRPNALLFFGTFVALVGLVFFVVTLPGSKYGLLLPGEAAPTSQDVWATTLQLAPRLLMLIFIQVLAGFFLRQYRTSMEDFRYYESVLRQREAQLLSYILRKQTGDKKAILSFAKEIMEPDQIGILGRGQTTAALEAERLAKNEFMTLYEKMAELVSVGKEKGAQTRKSREGSKSVHE